jgi:hypothetical protein
MRKNGESGVDQDIKNGSVEYLGMDSENKECHSMKIFKGIFIIPLVVLLITAGCTSGEHATETESPDLNDASPVFTEESLAIPPADTPEGQDISSLIVGDWKIQTGDQQILFWRFHNDGTLTGGSEAGSSQITGTWSTFGFEQFIVINAAGTTSNGEHITYNMAITRDPTNGTISVDNPVEDKTWEFIRQP